jgi:hypothetical protein
MFRIYNLQELQRLRTLLAAFDDHEYDDLNTSFPLDIFRNEKVISAFEFGENCKKTYAYTTGLRAPAVETSEGPDLRVKASQAEGEYDSLYGVVLLRFPIEKIEIQVADSGLPQA